MNRLNKKTISMVRFPKLTPLELVTHLHDEEFNPVQLIERFGIDSISEAVQGLIVYLVLAQSSPLMSHALDSWLDLRNLKIVESLNKISQRFIKLIEILRYSMDAPTLETLFAFVNQFLNSVLMHDVKGTLNNKQILLFHIWKALSESSSESIQESAKIRTISEQLQNGTDPANIEFSSKDPDVRELAELLVCYIQNETSERLYKPLDTLLEHAQSVDLRIRKNMLLLLFSKGFQPVQKNRYLKRVAIALLNNLSSDERAAVVMYIVMRSADCSAVKGMNSHWIEMMLKSLKIYNESEKLKRYFNQRQFMGPAVFDPLAQAYVAAFSEQELDFEGFLEKVDVVSTERGSDKIDTPRGRPLQLISSLPIAELGHPVVQPTDLARDIWYLVAPCLKLAQLITFITDDDLSSVFRQSMDFALQTKRPKTTLALWALALGHGDPMENLMQTLTREAKIFETERAARLIAQPQFLAMVLGFSNGQGLFIDNVLKILSILQDSVFNSPKADEIVSFANFVAQNGGTFDDLNRDNFRSYTSIYPVLKAMDKQTQKSRDGAENKSKYTILPAYRRESGCSFTESLKILARSNIFKGSNPDLNALNLQMLYLLVESGYSYRLALNIDYGDLLDGNSWVVRIPPKMVRRVLEGANSPAAIKERLSCFQQDLDAFIKKFNGRLILGAAAFHEAQFNIPVLGQVQNHTVRTFLIGICGRLMSRGLSLDELFGPKQDGLMYKIGPNVMMLSRGMITTEKLELFIEWFRHNYLRHAYHALLQINRYMGLQVSDSLTEKLKAMVCKNARQNPKEVVDLFAMITSYFQLKEPVAELNLADLGELIPNGLINDPMAMEGLTQNNSLPKELPLPESAQEMGENLPSLLVFWLKQLVHSFSEKYDIPMAVFERSKLPDQVLNEVLLNFSLLGSNSKIRNDHRLYTMFKYMVIVELLDRTKQVKSGQVQQDLLDNYFSSDQRGEFCELNFSHFPLIDQPEMIGNWLEECEAQMLVQQKTTAPQEEIENIMQSLGMAMDHLSAEFNQAKNAYEQLTVAEKVAYKRKLAGFGRDLHRALKQQSGSAPLEVCPDLSLNLSGGDTKTAYDRVVAQQRKVSLFDQLRQLQETKEVFFQFLGEIDRILGQVQEQDDLLQDLGYQIPPSPGIFMWTGELQLLRDKIRQKETALCQQGHGNAIALLKRRVEEFDDLRKKMVKAIGQFRESINKAAKQLAECQETEAVAQMRNTIETIDRSKKAVSQVVRIMDVTSIYRILAILKEDNNCLSPTSSLNPHTNVTFLDPNRKVLAVYGPTGNLLCNMLLTLGKVNNLNALVMDNLYARGNPTHYYPTVVEYLMGRFKVMNIPIVVTNKVRGAKEIGIGIDVKDAQIVLPRPVHGMAYHESNGGYTVYDKELRYTGDCIMIYPKLTARFRKPRMILSKTTDAHFIQGIKKLVGLLAVEQFLIQRPDAQTVNIRLSGRGAGVGRVNIQLTLREVLRSEGKMALEVNMEINRVGFSPQNDLRPGQQAKGGSPRLARTLFNWIFEFGKDQGFEQILSDPEYYHTFCLLRRVGFKLDPEAELTPHYQRLVDNIEQMFAQHKIRRIRKRSEMIAQGKLSVGEEIFQWPVAEHRMHMVLDLNP